MMLCTQLLSLIYRWANQTLWADVSGFGDRKILHMVVEKLTTFRHGWSPLTEVCFAVSTEWNLSRKVLTLHPTPDHRYSVKLWEFGSKETRENKIPQGRTEAVRWCLRNEMRTKMVGVWGRGATFASLPKGLLTGPIPWPHPESNRTRRTPLPE